MEYMEQQMQQQIEAGLSNAGQCYARIAELEGQSAALAARLEECLECLCSMQQCIGEITISYRLDAEMVGQQIYQGTGMTEPELRQVRADAVDEFMNKAMHEIANSYTSSTPVTPWESGMNSMLAMFAKYTQKYLKILRNNESTSILAGKE